VGATIAAMLFEAVVALGLAAALASRWRSRTHVAIIAALRPLANGDLTASASVPPGRHGLGRDRKMFWQSPVLPRGNHTMRARVTGEQNRDSRYIWVTLECVEIDG
jgi:hypothetical protein